MSRTGTPCRAAENLLAREAMRRRTIHNTDHTATVAMPAMSQSVNELLSSSWCTASIFCER